MKILRLSLYHCILWYCMQLFLVMYGYSTNIYIHLIVAKTSESDFVYMYTDPITEDTQL